MVEIYVRVEIGVQTDQIRNGNRNYFGFVNDAKLGKF